MWGGEFGSPPSSRFLGLCEGPSTFPGSHRSDGSKAKGGRFWIFYEIVLENTSNKVYFLMTEETNTKNE